MREGRLTKRVDENYVDKYGRDVKATSTEPNYKLINKLAEYEDLGPVEWFKTLTELWQALEDDRR